MNDRFLHDVSTYKVQSDNIVVSFHGVELDRKSARIPCFIGKLAAERNSRETHKDWRLLSYAGQEVGFLRVRNSILLVQ